MKKLNVKKVASLILLSLAVSVMSGCVQHRRYAYAVEGIKTISDFNSRTLPRNKYYISEYVFGGEGIKIGDAEYVNNIIRSSNKWSRIFEPKNHWLSFAKQTGIPVKVEVVGNGCCWFNWFGSGSSAEIVVTVSGERFSDDPIAVYTQYDYCRQCGETEYKPGTPNCNFKPLRSGLYWLEYTSYDNYVLKGSDGANAQYDAFFAAVAKKLKDLEDEGLISVN